MKALMRDSTNRSAFAFHPYIVKEIAKTIKILMGSLESINQRKRKSAKEADDVYKELEVDRRKISDQTARAHY